MDIGDWITLAAVVVALGIGVASILHTQSLQKQERKERLLNEIIEWATETIEWDIEKDYFTEKRLREADKPLLVILMQLIRLSEGFRSFKRKGQLILRPLALVFKHQPLTDFMDELIYNLQKHVELIGLQEMALMNDITAQTLSNEFNSAVNEVTNHKKQLDQSATKVISEATKLKSKL